MKKLLLLFCIVLSSVYSYGQSFSFGVKGGLNYGATGDIATINIDTEEAVLAGSSDVGYHLGFYTKFKLSKIFIQPELVYTRLSTDLEDSDGDFNYNFSKLDIPILLGIKIAGPLHLKLGPSFQLALSNEVDGGLGDIDVENPENSFVMNYQAGIGVQLGKLGIEARYEGGFKKNDAVSDLGIPDFGFVASSRPSQIMLSILYELGRK